MDKIYNNKTHCRGFIIKERREEKKPVHRACLRETWQKRSWDRRVHFLFSLDIGIKALGWLGNLPER